MKMKPRDLISGDHLPTLPEIYFQLEELAKDSECNYRDMGSLIERDSALTVRLMTIVNSAFYGFSEKIDNVSDAVRVVGMKQLTQLALSAIVMDRFRAIPQDLIDMRSFWKHSLACGLAGRSIAERLKYGNPESLFTASLLHDIGLPVLCIQAPDLAVKAMSRARTHDIPLHWAELDILGFHHADIGKALLNHWNMPQSLEIIVGYHHSPDTAPEFQQESSIVHVADNVANTLEIRAYAEKRTPPLGFEAREITLMGEEILFSSIIQDVTQQFETCSQVFLQIA